jgi:hypothetical protein
MALLYSFSHGSFFFLVGKLEEIDRLLSNVESPGHKQLEAMKPILNSSTHITAVT